VELKATAVKHVGVCDAATYPMSKKKQTFEFLREKAHLRPRTNTIGAVARIRNALAFATHTFFQKNGFLYVHTPIITASDCEGAGEMFQVRTAGRWPGAWVAGSVGGRGRGWLGVWGPQCGWCRRPAPPPLHLWAKSPCDACGPRGQQPAATTLVLALQQRRSARPGGCPLPHPPAAAGQHAAGRRQQAQQGAAGG
jgi:hypothetical protein